MAYKCYLLVTHDSDSLQIEETYLIAHISHHPEWRAPAHRGWKAGRWGSGLWIPFGECLFHAFFQSIYMQLYVGQPTKFASHPNVFRTDLSVAYLGLSLNTSNLNGNIFFNCFLSALMEFPAYALSWVLFRYFPRRLCVSSSLFLGGLMILFIQLIPSGRTMTTNTIEQNLSCSI